MCLKNSCLTILFLLSLTTAHAQITGRDSINNKSDSIIKEVKIFASKNNFVSKLLRNFLVKEKKSISQTEKKFSNKSYDQYEGKIIRNIDILVLDVFGASINNLGKKETGWFEKTGNKVHQNTKEWVVRQRLLFKKGDQIEPLKISETERILRQYRNTYDARVYLSTVPKAPDSVDIFVLAQDVWSITGSGSLDPITPSGNLKLRDVNFLGLGNELSGGGVYNKNDSVNWHYSLEFINNNIAHTFFVGNIYYKNLPTDLNYGVGINKEFFSPIVKFAGGVNINWLKDRRFIYGIDSVIEGYGFDNSQQDLWAGYAANFGKQKNERTYYGAARILNTIYTKHPQSDSFKLAYQNYTILLGSVGYSFRRFIKDNFIFGLGRTEDIPIGKSLSLTAGYEYGQIVNRPYFGIRGAVSHYIQTLGYLSGSLELGGFRLLNHWQDEVITGEILFYSKLISLGSWRWRHFFWDRITYGYNTAPGKILNINKREGIRGFSGDYIVGNKKFVINYESAFFTPYNILGFRTAFVLFGDFAFIGMNQESLFKSKFYQAFGLGFRFRNEHLIFRTIQFTFAYYPGVKKIDERQFKFFEDSRNFYQFTNFQFSRPRVVEF
jgi:hypothetical protein